MKIIYKNGSGGVSILHHTEALSFTTIDETISSRAWCCKDTNSFWGFMRKLIVITLSLLKLKDIK